MQLADWNDLRFLLALYRGRSLAVAARRLHVDATTVARRLTSLETALATKLLRRAPDGSWHLTEAGERIIPHAERIEREAGGVLASISGASTELAGTVRITSVPIIVNRILVPSLSRLFKSHPLLEIDMIAEPRDLSLTRHEADIAIRLARPLHGGRSVMGRRIGFLRYDVYAPAGCSGREAAKLPWITYEEAFAHIPQARWIAARTAAGESKARIAVNDATTVIEAVAAGLGKSLLPRIVGDNDDKLRRMRHSGSGPLVRELWLLTHRDTRDLARIAATCAWIEHTLAGTAKP